MTDITTICEGCGAPLQSPDAVCARCEAELAAEPPTPPCKYVCPCCDERFTAPAQVLWPPKVPWWRPTTSRLQCPRCDASLQDRRDIPYPGWVAIGGAGLAICLYEFLPQRMRGLVAPLPWVAVFAHQAWQDWKGSRDPHRYVAGIRRLWLRQPKDLTPAKRPDAQDSPE